MDPGFDLLSLLGAGLVGLWLGGVLALTGVPRTRLARTVWGLAVCAALWALGDLVASLARDMFWKQIGIGVLYSGAIFLPSVWWTLALRWAEDRGAAPASRLGLRLPLVFAACMWLVMLANPWHGRFIVPVMGGRNVYGPLWWLMALPNYALILAAAAVELRVMRRIRNRATRSQGAFLVAASGITLVANWAWVAGLAPRANVTLPVISAAVLTLVVGMLREGLFGVLPSALPVMASHDPDGLLVVRVGGRLVHANPSARAHLAPLDVAGDALLPGALAPWLEDADGRPLARSGPGWEERWWQAVLQPGGALYRYGGEGLRWLRMSAQPVPGRRGGVLAHCVRVHDATEEQRAQSEMRRARSLDSVAELSRGVAHDFNNLLAVIRGNADLLLDEVPDAPRLQRKVDQIVRAADQAGELASHLQLYAGAASPRRTLLDLSSLVRETLEGIAPRACDATSRPVDVILDLAPQPLPVEADATQLRQVLLNLFVNACDALGERGDRIRVATTLAHLAPASEPHLVLGREHPPGGYACLSVCDNGAGIEVETQERIFQPFFSTKGKQRGIGLATVLGVARGHDAPLGLESRLGQGTTFYLYLPLAEPGPEPGARG